MPVKNNFNFTKYLIEEIVLEGRQVNLNIGGSANENKEGRLKVL